MKDRAILSGLTPDMWKPEHDQTIENFFSPPRTDDTKDNATSTALNQQSRFLLAIFVDPQMGLVVDGAIPPQPVEEICYFIKRDNGAEITGQNVENEVQYGTVRTGHIESLLRLMQSIYAPLFFDNTSWPDSILF